MNRTLGPQPARRPWCRLRWPRAWLLVVAWLALAVDASDGARADATQERLNGLAARYAKLETELANTEDRVARLAAERDQADRVLQQRSRDLSARAAYLYKQGGQGAAWGRLLLARDAGAFRKQLELLTAVSDRDAMVVDEVEIAKARGVELRERLEATRRHQQETLSALRGQQRQLQAELDEAKERQRALDEAKERQRKSERQTRDKAPRSAPLEEDRPLAPLPRSGRYALPILGPVGFADTWGAPRSGGRRHQGTDVMAPCGAKVVAVEDGVVSDTQEGGSGGIMLWIRGRTGDRYFYAHLQGYADGLRAGRSVSAGELIAYNGNSGNARGGPCHVHFQWHPGGGQPANPYKLLRFMT